MTTQTADGLVQTVREGRVLAIELARPAARNAISAAMLQVLLEAVDEAAAEGVAVVTLTGAGPAFCAGADIRSYRDADADPAALREFTAAAGRLCDALEQLDAVVVAGVHGACLGGGFELALSADLVIAADDARFGLPEVRLGLIPGWGGTQRLTRAVGPNLARSMILRAHQIDAETAHRVGLVSQVVPAAALRSTMTELAHELASGPTRALVAATRAIRAAAAVSASGMQLEREELLALFGTRDGMEGVAAFTERRPPRFVGA
ncbi:enoyl-CoA hydratase/isomerase family protein [Pseudactinotalea suaedae]|uniref:enoyl-CoA hydratase/isomerase family protein n=1 Tax=Pseudactinotalea suaedae TaxID=1524924 RepID=UPI0012E2C1B1|nr:enoyl-CoA hydratase/isomerase family protein [Pseudactinotalea suaedae]